MLPFIMDIIKNTMVPVLEITKLHVGYFICCETYVDDLNVRVKNLEPKKKDRQELANEIGYVPTHELEDWLNKVQQLEDDTKRMADMVGEHQRCFTWLSDLGSRYNLGKEAAEKKAIVDELLQQKLDHVSRPAPVPGFESLPSGDFQAFKSTTLVIMKVVVAVKNFGVDIIGLYGMGGIGKTTLVEEVSRQAMEWNMFKKVIMVTVSQKPIMESIQEKMAEQLGIDIKQEAISSAKLFRLIKQAGKVLLILDDMWSYLNLSKMGIPSECCKIIITSRSLEVCNSMGSKTNIQLGALSPADSWELFKANSMVAESPDMLCRVARDVASECGGLPLAIVTVGRALIGKGLVDWKDALIQLRAGTPDNILELKSAFNHLKVSYELLGSKEAQSCFLFCSLFPDDHEIYVEDLTMYAMGEKFLTGIYTLQGARDRIRFLVNKLKASCLLLEGKDEECVKMHDVVRDVATYIGADKNEGCLSKAFSSYPNWDELENLNDCKRLSLMGNYIHDLPEQLPECSQLRTLLLQMNSGLKEIPDNFFEKMTSLRVLNLRGTTISSLPKSMSYLTNLRTLLLDGCIELEDVSALGDQKSLEVLSLRLTQVRKLPEEIGRLTNLKYLDLREIDFIKIPPKVISNLTRLEELHVGESFRDWEVGRKEPGENASLNEIISLTKLEALSVSVDNFKHLVRCDMDFKGKLERFCIQAGVFGRKYDYVSNCLRLQLSKSSIPHWVTVLLEKTADLTLWHSSCPQLDDASVGFESLKRLKLVGCNEMEFVVHGGVPPRITFHNLEKLSLYYMEKLKDITRDILLPGSLSNLRVLKVHYCPKLNITPIMQFANGLEELEVTWYNAAEILNNSDCMVSKRTSVTMTEIDKTGGGCDHAFLPRLRRLVLQVLPQLISIWKRDSMPPLGSLSNLTELNVQYCNKLRYLLSLCLAQRLDRLELLVIIGCDVMEKLISVEDEKVVVQSSEVAERLTSVSFSMCISPLYLIFSNLRELYISDCPGFRSLFSIGLAQNLMQLESLTVYRCLQMEVILKGEVGEIENEEESVRGKRILFPRW
ncbi:Disease resistance protein [Acorus calamus]|uniref:Disease resistance protein n=1 Tax=Acorus calamus TaxID=4465 RepID=A0AAV9C587_ACOCL|nr:Disease resistance protein [Acorus calamus]